jgi:hypothetical protein
MISNEFIFNYNLPFLFESIKKLVLTILDLEQGLT